MTDARRAAEKKLSKCLHDAAIGVSFGPEYGDERFRDAGRAFANAGDAAADLERRVEELEGFTKAIHRDVEELVDRPSSSRLAERVESVEKKLAAWLWAGPDAETFTVRDPNALATPPAPEPYTDAEKDEILRRFVEKISPAPGRDPYDMNKTPPAPEPEATIRHFRDQWAEADERLVKAEAAQRQAEAKLAEKKEYCDGILEQLEKTCIERDEAEAQLAEARANSLGWRVRAEELTAKLADIRKKGEEWMRLAIMTEATLARVEALVKKPDLLEKYTSRWGVSLNALREALGPEKK